MGVLGCCTCLLIAGIRSHDTRCVYEVHKHTMSGPGNWVNARAGCVGKGLVIHFPPYPACLCQKVMEICTGGRSGWDPGLVMVCWDAGRRFIYRVLCPGGSAHPPAPNLRLSRNDEVYTIHRFAACGVCIHRRGCHHPHQGVSFRVEVLW